MNVSIHASEPEGDKPAKKILIAAKDFEAGDIIYTVRFSLQGPLPQEKPMSSVLGKPLRRRP